MRFHHFSYLPFSNRISRWSIGTRAPIINRIIDFCVSNDRAIRAVARKSRPPAGRPRSLAMQAWCPDLFHEPPNGQQPPQVKGLPVYPTPEGSRKWNRPFYGSDVLNIPTVPSDTCCLRKVQRKLKNVPWLLLERHGRVETVINMDEIAVDLQRTHHRPPGPVFLFGFLCLASRMTTIL